MLHGAWCARPRVAVLLVSSVVYRNSLPSSAEGDLQLALLSLPAIAAPRAAVAMASP